MLVSDECYVELGWEADPVSVLHPDVCGGSPEGILAVHSLSKRSNLAGYRCAFVAGDPALVGELLAVRKNLGLMMPGPQQVAMAAALADDAHVDEQRERYAARRAVLRRGPGGRRVPDRPLRGVAVPLGDPGRGLLGRPSTRWPTSASWSPRASFYGAAGREHVRVALTATDERVPPPRTGCATVWQTPLVSGLDNAAGKAHR